MINVVQSTENNVHKPFKTFGMQFTLNFTKIARNAVFASALLASTFVMTSCNNDDDDAPMVDNTITGQVVANPNFSLLEAAVLRVSNGTTTNVAQVLAGTGPFTVFAPDNDAFAASGIDLNAINSLPVETLLAILTNHVLPGRVLAADVPAGPNAEITMLGSETAFVTRANGQVFINGIRVKAADVSATNGVIHVVERVIIPPVENIVVAAQADPQLTYLVAAVLRASTGTTNVAEVLSGDGPFTVFAPTNQAFINAGFETIEEINAAPADALTSILTHHVISARVFSSDLTEGASVPALNQENLRITLQGGAKVQGATNTTPSNIIATNILTGNGVVHKIDQVLLPTPTP